MMSQLHDSQALFEAVFEGNVPITFNNDTQALGAAREGVALCDRSHWGRIEVLDSDRLSFLHNQTTNNFQGLKPGQSCDTVFVTSTARTIDLATAYVTEDAVLLLVSPHRCQDLMQWMDKYIFFSDKVVLKDITNKTATFSLIGAKSNQILEQLGTREIIGQPDGNHQLFQIGTIDVRIAAGSGLALPGYTLITAIENAATLWKQLIEMSVIPMGDRVWEQLRIQQGRPVPNQELTEDYNPLEAGLWHTISFEKGCYIGQETIARLNTYKGVKQQLWGVKLQAPVQPETIIMVGEEKVGKLTSYTTTPEGNFGLAYIRTKAGSAGLKVQVGDTEGELVTVPFISVLSYQG